jgi:hypothetical protein
MLATMDLMTLSFPQAMGWLKGNPAASGLLSGFGLIFGALGVIFAGAGLAILLSDIVTGAPEGSFARARAKRDEAVEALLYSKDLVEVTRAGVLIEQLNCGVRRRLP